VQPDVTTTYRLRASNACGSVDTADAIVTVQNAPNATSLTVLWTGTQVQFTFAQSSAPGGLLRYEYQRLPEGTIVSAAPPAGAANTYVNLYDATAVSGNAYAYRIRAVDNRGVASAWSSYDLATAVVFSNDPSAAGVTPIRGVHIAELRIAIDAVRRLVGLPTVWSSYGSVTGPVLASQMTEMRTALDEARAFLNLPAVVYSQPGLTAGSTTCSHFDIDQLRQGVK
jgi:hypothetical protein